MGSIPAARVSHPVVTPRAPAEAITDLERRELPAAAALLAAAFRDNPINRAVIGEPAARRLRCNRAGSRVSLHVALAGGGGCRVERAGGVLRGLLLAEPPGLRPLPLPPTSLQLRCLFGQGWRVARRWQRVHSELDSLRPAEAHWYVHLLGVAPAAQGRGLGRALLRDLLVRVDAEGAASYLETDRPENLRFYEREGYAVVSEEQIVGVSVWRMWRAARAAHATGETHVR